MNLKSALIAAALLVTASTGFASNQELGKLEFHADAKPISLVYEAFEASGLVDIRVRFQSEGYVIPNDCSEGNCTGNGNTIEAVYNVPGLSFDTDANQVVLQLNNAKPVVCATTATIPGNFWHNQRLVVTPTSNCTVTLGSPEKGLVYSNKIGALAKGFVQSVNFTAR